jgi:hypothetical protein
MTRLQARQILRDHDMTITKRDDEYRVNYKDGDENSAYYTNCIFDAVDTGIEMRKAVNAVHQEAI